MVDENDKSPEKLLGEESDRNLQVRNDESTHNAPINGIER